MVMPVSNAKTIAAGAGDGTQGGRRPTVVPAPAPAEPELVNRPKRRKFSAADKLRILKELDAGSDTPGAAGAIIRREGLYSSAITDWRRQRAAGTFAALSPVQRGPKPSPINPLAAQLAQAERENRRLKQRLERAEIIIAIQKKVAALLGETLPDTSHLDGEDP